LSIEVPAEPTCTDPMALRIGYVSTLALAQLCGGESLDIPDIGAQLRAMREARVRPSVSVLIPFISGLVFKLRHVLKGVIVVES
jgi:hypothetical protein